jgi:hypothetical protein
MIVDMGQMLTDKIDCLCIVLHGAPDKILNGRVKGNRYSNRFINPWVYALGDPALKRLPLYQAGTSPLR